MLQFYAAMRTVPVRIARQSRDDDEATAIAIALGVAAGGALQGVEEPVLAALTKLERLLPQHIRARVDAVRRTAVPIGGADRVTAGVLDVDRQAWRTLRADRITHVAATGHRFVLDDPPDAADLVSRASGVSPYRYVAHVVVHASPENLSAKVPPTIGIVEPHPDGAMLTVGADGLAFLSGHLVALDLPFEALDPPELIDVLRRAGERLMVAHRRPEP